MYTLFVMHNKRVEKTAHRFVSDTRRFVTNKICPRVEQIIKRSNAHTMCGQPLYGLLRNDLRLRRFSLTILILILTLHNKYNGISLWNSQLVERNVQTLFFIVSTIRRWADVIFGPNIEYCIIFKTPYIRRLKSFEMTAYRKLLRILWTAYRINALILEKLNIRENVNSCLQHSVKYLKLFGRKRWLGKIIIQGKV